MDSLAASDPWERVLAACIPAIVTIDFMTVRHFDTYNAGCSSATGFVVDFAKGLILTNRHVVRPGPVVARAKFSNHEEVEIHALYRDPVHDYGFYHFDASQLRFQQADGGAAEIRLAPHKVKVGIPVRVVGNDACERMSILQGTIARLDRQAPRYGTNSYNDHNTFYIQAASMTSGGSSGSPVLNSDGEAVALNAGSQKKAASSFYLPLDRPLRALEILQSLSSFEELPACIPRGSLQTVFLHETFDECRRLGLLEETEAAVRSARPKSTGLLVVSRVIKGGIAWSKLQHGDVLLRLNGMLVLDFLCLEETLDDNVGKRIEVTVERGGVPLSVTITVCDLYAITPSSLLDFGGGVFHQVSYQQAINHDFPCMGIVVATPGFALRRAGIPRGAVILAVDEQEVLTLDDLQNAMQRIPHGGHAAFRYVFLSDQSGERVDVVTIDRMWNSAQRFQRECAGVWVETPVQSPENDAPTKKVHSTTFEESRPGLAKLARSLVMVRFTTPYQLNGLPSSSFVGCGVIVDAARGWVVVDRATVPYSLGDLHICFAGSVQIPGRVVFVHPIHNFTVVEYSPELIGSTPVLSATCSEVALLPGDQVKFVGLTSQLALVHATSAVTQIEKLKNSPGKIPYFRDTNIRVIQLGNHIKSVGGILCTEEGHIQALWASFCTATKDGPKEIMRGIPFASISDLVAQLRENPAMNIRSLEVEMWDMPLYKARQVGLSEEWADRLQRETTNRVVLSVLRLVANSPAATALRVGDIILAVDGQVVSQFQEVEKLTAEADVVELLLLRNGKEVTASVATVQLSGCSVDRMLLWAGAFIQESYRALLMTQKVVSEGVYVSRYFLGSPAEFYGLRAKIWITAVNGVATKNVPSFLATVNSFAGQSSFLRLDTTDLAGKKKIVTLKPECHYWKTSLFTLSADGSWRRETTDLQSS